MQDPLFNGQHVRFCYVLTYEPQTKAHTDISSRAKGLNFVLPLHLHVYFVYAVCQSSMTH